ncbi:MAG: hypothetical protein QOD26_3502 [Betaproteobacteria bacterium]|jgi:hypothetical protein|nr:hypothetical protein [Betaproteobacteria bacterium]
MHRGFTASLLIALAGCAAYSGAGLAPGVATEAEVEKAMGPSADRRQRADGEVVRYYSRLPAGREMYAARFGRDGKLIAVEQRLTRDVSTRIVAGKSSSDDVRELLGPPYRILSFPRIDSEVWLYPMHEGAVRMTLDVDLFSASRLVREVRLFDEVDPD